MRLTIDEAHALIRDAMMAIGHDAGDAAAIAEHLMDCELRGLSYGGLARAVTIAERFARLGDRRAPMAIDRETPVSALVRGSDHVGYVVARRAARIAIDKARAMGIAVVAANDTWYTGMLSFYAEMAAREGLVALIASNATPWVAPHGASEGRFGTNPFCIGFPSVGAPVIWDIGVSQIIHAEATLARRLGQELPEGVAYDSEGNPTRDPAAALAGAFACWGGHRGSGLGIAVQLLGMMAGSPATPPEVAGFGFVMIALRPDLFGPGDAFAARVAAYGDVVRAARPAPGHEGARMPFERSSAERARRLREGYLEAPDVVAAALRRIIATPPDHEETLRHE